MLKKSLIYIVVFTFLFSSTFLSFACAEEVDLAPNAKAAILIDNSSGAILFEKNSHQELFPASLTKVMTMLLIMEAIENGKITLNDTVVVSEYAASMGGSQIFLEPGEEMSVDDLLKGIAVASGNDASVAMAEYIAGSEELFVNMMNAKGKEIGLKNTNFVNSNGLPSENHYTSAYDMALMSKELLKYKNITNYTSIYQDYLRKDTENPLWLVNTNRLVRFYEGLDGLKTGYTSEAKFCLSATAVKNNFRVIAVAMGEPNTKTRNSEVTKLLNYAFSQYKNEILYESEDEVIEIKVEKGKESYVKLIAPSQIGVLMRKGESIEEYEQVIEVDDIIKAPIKKGSVLGEVQTLKEGKIISSSSIVAKNDVEKANLWDMLKKSTKGLLFIEKK